MGAVEHMRQTADMLRETESFLEQQTQEALKYCAKMCEKNREGEDAQGYRVEVEAFRQFHIILQKRMLYM